MAKCMTLYSPLYSCEEELMNKSSYCRTPIVKIGSGQSFWNTYVCCTPIKKVASGQCCMYIPLSSHLHKLDVISVSFTQRGLKAYIIN